MKKIIYVIIIVFIFLTNSVSANIYDNVLTEEDRQQVENSFEHLNISSDIDISAMELVENLNNGNFDKGFDGLIDKVKSTIFDVLRENFRSFTKILFVILLASVVTRLNAIKENNMSNMITNSVVILTILEAFFGISDIVINVIDTLTLFINGLIPVLLTMLATSGKIVTANLLNPIILSTSSIATMIIKFLILPLVTINLSLKLTYAATEKENTLLLSKHIGSLIKWLIGFMLTIYMGLIGLSSTVAVNIDETTLKTAKFAIGSFIPYVGSMLSDSVELVFSSTLVVKNSLGVVGLIGVIAVIMTPCIILIVKVLLFKLMCVLALPVGEKTVIAALDGVSDCASVMLGMVLVVAVMYILSITVIINAGGA